MDREEVASKFRHLDRQRKEIMGEDEAYEKSKGLFCWWLMAAAMTLVLGRVVLTIVYWGR